MIGKLTDAASMLWLNLDSRERMILLYGAAVAVVIVCDLLAQQERENHDERIARRAAAIVRDGR